MLQAEQRAAVVQQVELRVAPAPVLLPSALAVAERHLPAPRHDLAVGGQEGVRDRPRELQRPREAPLVQVVEEQPADAARLAAVRQEEVLVAGGP